MPGRMFAVPMSALVVVSASLIANSALAQEAKDDSGTNPAIQSRSLSISNEYRLLEDDRYYDITNLRFTQPLGDGSSSIRLTIPLNGTDIPGDDRFGLGDIAAKFSWVPYISRRQAFILSTELYAPTANEDILGTGKWIVAPGITWANFVSPSIIIAPAYIQNFSIGGDSDRTDVNRGDFDLYMVYKPKGKAWWITSDATISHDFENGSTPVSWELTFGRALMQLKDGGALNGYIRPGIGIGQDRPYNFNIEVGLTLINF